MIQKLIAVGLVLVGANFLIFDQGLPEIGTIGFFLFILFGNIFTILAFYSQKETKRQVLALSAAGVAILSTLLSLFRANGVDIFWLSMQAMLLSSVALYLFALTHEEFGSVMELFVFPFRLASSWFESAGKLLRRDFFALWSKGKKLLPQVGNTPKVSSSTLGSIVRGLIITVPVLFVIVGLLASADPIFSKTISNLFSFKLPHIAITLPARLVFTVFTALFITPFAFLSIKEKFHSPLMQKHFGKYGLEFVILSGAIASVLALFLLIQFRYLFLAKPDIQLQDFGIGTYSEYVRKGFGELTMVAGIVYVVVAGSLVVFRQAEKYRETLKKINIVLLGEIIIFILSILRRVMLYQVEHGLTRVRVYGTFFLLMLIALTVVLLLRHIHKKLRHWYIYEAGIVVATILLMALVNIDHAVATFLRPTVNNEVDYVYISRLSEDGVEGWIDAVAVLQQQPYELWMQQSQFTSDEARTIVYSYQTTVNLYNAYAALVRQYGSPAQQETLVLATYRSYSMLDSNMGKLRAYQRLTAVVPFDQMKRLSDNYTSLFNRLTPDQKNRLYDRSFNSPLID